MIRPLVALAVAALCCGTPAAAQNRSDCPVARDAQSGIRLTRQAPLFDVVLRKKGRLVSEDRTSVVRGTKRRVKATYLHGLVPLVRVEGSQKIEMKIANKGAAILSGGRVRNWSSPVRIYIGGKLFGSGTVDVRRIGAATWSGNGCTYKVTRVKVSTSLEGKPTSHFEYFFAPELGISLGSYKLGRDGRTRVNSVLPERIARK